VPDGIIVVDAEGRVVEVNREAEALFGYARDELLGQPVETLLPEAARERHRAHRGTYRADPVARAMGTGLELVAERRNGERFPVDVSLGPVPGPAREVLAVVRDITAHRQEEARLGYLAAIVESCNDAVYSQDRDGTITAWNPAARVLFGYEAEEVLGWRSTRLFPEDLWADHEVVLRRVLGGEILGQVETEILRRDRVSVPAVLTVSPIRDAHDRVIGASVIARDVTEQRLALATLADSEKRLRESEALAHVGGWVIDAATGAVQWSEELHRIHGVEPSEFDGTLEGVLAFVHPDDRAIFGRLGAVLAQRSPVEGEYRIVRPDGRIRWLYSRAEPVVDHQDTAIGLRGICQDVTERHDAAEAIRTAYDRERSAAERLRAADLVKDEFLATVSHELRTPLTTILGFAPLLRDPPESARTPDIVERIERNARDMLGMVERVLDFSRLTAGAVEIHPKQVVLDDLIGDLLDDDGPRLVDARIKYSSGSRAVQVLAAREATRHILGNLLSNAAKFSPAGGLIEVATAVEDGWGVVSVSDEGRGIPVDLREQVFERFYRAADQPAGERGAGVGLAIARRYAEMQGGRIWCESGAAAGAVFRFTIPLSAAPRR